MDKEKELTQGLRGLLQSRKGTLCLIILLLTAFLLLAAGAFSHWNASILVAAFSCFGVIGSVVSAIFCSGNTREAIANAANATTITTNNAAAVSLMGDGPPAP
jgi:Trk-type K+ transport system membrane component